jgi:hypothetical protein
MLLAVVGDVRLVVVKLAEQLQKMRPRSRSSAALQRKLAIETREVYAPLANRLGVWQVKWELEDLAFRYLQPLDYKRIAAALKTRRSSASITSRSSRAPAAARAARRGHRGADRGRPEAHLQHLAQDAGQAARLRSAHGHSRGARARAERRRLLCGARNRAFAVAVHSRRIRRLHRDAEGQPVPLDSHRGHRSGQRAGRDPDPHARDARQRRARRGRALALQGGRTRRPGLRAKINQLRNLLSPAEGGETAATSSIACASICSRIASTCCRRAARSSTYRSAARRSILPIRCTRTSATARAAPRSTAAWCRSTIS